jgi:hypothetical protein
MVVHSVYMTEAHERTTPESGGRVKTGRTAAACIEDGSVVVDDGARGIDR